jgi:small subunit ribosomal protein S7
VPTPISDKRKLSLAIKWIIAAARSRKGRPMADRLQSEIMDAFKNEVIGT